MKTEVLFEESHIEIEYNPEAKILHVSWKGDQTVDSMKNGFDKILECMRARECSKVHSENEMASPAYV